MIFELLVRFVVVAFDGCLFDRSIHSLDLPICPRMIDFRQPMFDSVLVTNTVKQVHKRPFIFCTVSKLNAVVGQNRMDVIRDNGNQLA